LCAAAAGKEKEKGKSGQCRRTVSSPWGRGRGGRITKKEKKGKRNASHPLRAQSPERGKKREEISDFPQHSLRRERRTVGSVREDRKEKKEGRERTKKEKKKKKGVRPLEIELLISKGK